MPGPLEGFRVIDVSAIVSGPLADMILADQGADVVKIEPPVIGDLMRAGAHRLHHLAGGAGCRRSRQSHGAGTGDRQPRPR